MNFLHLDSNMPSAPPYGVYFSQLVSYNWALILYSDICNVTVF